MQNAGSNNNPLKDKVGGVLNITSESYHEEELTKLLDDVNLYSLSIYGEGATIKTKPFINVLACSPGNPACVLDVIDCMNHMSEGWKKDAKFIAIETLKVICKIDRIPTKSIIQIMFHRASNIQQAGEIMRQHFSSAIVEHGAEHVVSLVVEKFVSLPCF